MKPLSLVRAVTLCVSLASVANAQSSLRNTYGSQRSIGGFLYDRFGDSSPSQPDPKPPTLQEIQSAKDAALVARYKREADAIDARIVEHLTRRVEDGSADAAFDLGVRYHAGKGVPQDAAKARQFMALASERGNEQAKAWLKNPPAAPEAPLPKEEPARKLETSPTRKAKEASGEVVSREYANSINWFILKHDMVAEDVMRWDFVMSASGMTLSKFGELLDNVGEFRDRVAGHHIDLERHNPDARLLKVGDEKPAQSPELSDKEKSMVSMMIAAGYGKK